LILIWANFDPDGGRYLVDIIRSEGQKFRLKYCAAAASWGHCAVVPFAYNLQATDDSQDSSRCHVKEEESVRFLLQPPLTTTSPFQIETLGLTTSPGLSWTFPRTSTELQDFPRRNSTFFNIQAYLCRNSTLPEPSQSDDQHRAINQSIRLLDGANRYPFDALV
jgi:hypothetical protein